MWLRRYSFTRAIYRTTVDLQTFYEGIMKSIREVLGEGVAVCVERGYYEYYVNEKPTRGQLIAIGRKISFYCPEIRQYARIYVPKKKGSKPIRQILKKVLEEKI